MLTIFAASNLGAVLPRLTEGFASSRSETVRWDVRLGSSGRLAHQILLGAEGDLFLAADEAYPEDLASHGIGVGEPRRYTRGSLVLVHGDPGLPRFSTVEDALVALRGEAVILANPELAPYGAAAQKLLERYGLEDLKRVLGESVGQARQFFLSTGTWAFLPRPTALEIGGDEALWIRELDGEEGTEIVQSGLVLRPGPGDDFLAWIRGPGQEILIGAGYEGL